MSDPWVTAARHIVTELRGIKRPGAAAFVPLLLEVIDSADRARAALYAAYDYLEVTQLRVLIIGDGKAMSGLLLAGRWGTRGEAKILVVLTDCRIKALFVLICPPIAMAVDIATVHEPTIAQGLHLLRGSQL